MCMVSFVGNEFNRTVPYQHPWVFPSPNTTTPFVPASVTREEFEALKREVEAVHDLLRAAKRYDEATGQPDCEIDEKVQLIKDIAKLVGVNLDDVFTES